MVTGPELAVLDEEDRPRLVTQASVFARVSPEQKLRIIRALQKAGRVLAMTGAGANDAAAIWLADVGIGMAARGSSAASSAADLRRRASGCRAAPGVLDDPTSADDRHGDPAGVVLRHQLELTVADGHDVGGR